MRLKKDWENDFDAWNERSLEGKRSVYLWADGVYFNIRRGNQERSCVLVIMGATADGRKELLAVEDGLRKSEEAWYDLLLKLRNRGLTDPPELAVGDGAIGFWTALAKVYPKTRTQRCWGHKTANVLNRLPKSLHAKTKSGLHEIWMAETREREEAEKAFDRFPNVYEAKSPKAVECLAKDREELLAFYDFPAEHWWHLQAHRANEQEAGSRSQAALRRLECREVAKLSRERAAFSLQDAIGRRA